MSGTVSRCIGEEKLTVTPHPLTEVTSVKSGMHEMSMAQVMSV